MTLRPPIDEPIEIPESAQEACNAVCQAVEDWNEQPEMLPYLQAYAFGGDWLTAWRYVPRNSRCGRLIDLAVDALVKASGVWMAENGQTFTREQIETYQGRESYIVDSQTGESRRMIEWPTGTYAGGMPSYEKPEGWG